MGNLPNGEVTKGLYEYFEHMAQQVRWRKIRRDNLCMPKETAARGKAIRTMQSYAADSGQRATAQILVEARADPNLSDQREQTAQSYAAEIDKTAIPVRDRR